MSTGDPHCPVHGFTPCSGMFGGRPCVTDVAVAGTWGSPQWTQVIDYGQYNAQPWPTMPSTTTGRLGPAPLTISDADIDRIADRVLARLDARPSLSGRAVAAAARVREVLRRIRR